MTPVLKHYALIAAFGIPGFLIMPGGNTVRGLVAGILLAVAGAIVNHGYND